MRRTLARITRTTWHEQRGLEASERFELSELEGGRFEIVIDTALEPLLGQAAHRNVLRFEEATEAALLDRVLDEAGAYQWVIVELFEDAARDGFYDAVRARGFPRWKINPNILNALLDGESLSAGP